MLEERKAVRLWTVVLILLCAGTLVLLSRNIERTLPYPQHTDEGYIAGPASNILRTGSLHPYKFNYPSLPAYIAAGAMAVGFVRSASHLEMNDINQLGHLGYPYYENPRVMQTARQAFALLSIMALAMTGLSAWLAFRKPATILLAPLFLAASPLFFRHSWAYLNVDIVGTSFVTMTLAACLAGTRQASRQQSALVPGIFAGLAIASKYTLVAAVLPVFLAIVLYFPRAQVLSTSVLALAAVIVAFIAAVPYSLIDIRGFLNGVASEAFHYASGHQGFTDEPGLGQLLFYLRHFVSEFGYGAAALAVVGVLRFSREDWRRAAVLAICPVGVLWLLSVQRVHFTRNALAIHPFVALFAAFGFATVCDHAVKLVARRGWVRGTVKVHALIGIVLFVATVPLWQFVEHFRDRTDSRNVAGAWVAGHLPRDWTIVVPTELGFDPRGLEMDGRHIRRVDLRPATDADRLDALLKDVPAPAAIMVPRWGADRRSPGQREADTLNSLSRQWRVLERFGSNDVLVNYSFSTAWGDPAFAVAVLR